MQVRYDYLPKKLEVNDLVDEVQEQARASAARKKKQNRSRL